MILFRRHWFLPLIILFGSAWIIQFSEPLIIGADGFLHGRWGVWIGEQGFLRKLPQAFFSWFNTDRMSDKDFLYHLYLFPFVNIFGYWVGTKLGALMATFFLYGSVLFCITKSTSNKLAVWMSLFLLFSGQFLRDTAEARPFVFAMAFTVLGIYAIVRQSPRWVFVTSLLYGMTHLSGWLLPMLAVGTWFVGYLSGSREKSKIVLYSIGGYLLSFVLHPNFPNNVFYFYLNGILVPYYAAKTGVLELGAEFFPLYTHEVLRNFPGLIGGLGFAGFLAVVCPPRFRKELGVWTIACLLFGVMALVSKRNMTHLYPVFVVWFGVVIGSIGESFKDMSKEFVFRVKFTGTIGFFLIAGYSTWVSMPILQASLLGDHVYGEHFKRVGEFLNKMVPPGSRVFHTNWSDTQFLIGVAPNYEYIVTLDPIYMYNFSPGLYTLYRSVSFGGQTDVYKVLKESFGASYGYAGKNYFNAFIEQVRKDTRFTIVGEDQMGIVFALKEASASGAPQKSP